MRSKMHLAPRHTMVIVLFSFIGLVSAQSESAGTGGSTTSVLEKLPNPTALVKLVPNDQCDRCQGFLMPGKIVPHPETRWGIISDLPESFDGYGVLYSTRPVLPENGGAPEMLRQVNTPAFVTIDSSFDVFLFHLNKNREQASRLVVLIRNKGQHVAEIRPFQVMKTEGIIGTVHEFENTLTRRTMARLWDRTERSMDGTYPEITFGDNPPAGQTPPSISIPAGQAT